MTLYTLDSMIGALVQQAGGFSLHHATLAQQTTPAAHAGALLIGARMCTPDMPVWQTRHQFVAVQRIPAAQGFAPSAECCMLLPMRPVPPNCLRFHAWPQTTKEASPALLLCLSPVRQSPVWPWPGARECMPYALVQ
jgi:hypothetical protein